MKIRIIASGSKGNCYLIKTTDARLMIECGLPIKKIQEALNYQLTKKIDACFVTHEHQDHSRAARDIAALGVDVYMTEGTKGVVGPGVHRFITFYQGPVEGVYNPVILGGSADTRVFPFLTEHDASEPCGFLIKDHREQLVFITDSAFSKFRFPKADYFLVETNYCKGKLDEGVRGGSIDIHRRNRTVMNHMSLEAACGFLKASNAEGAKGIYLLHLSDENADEGLIQKTIEEQFHPQKLVIC